MKPNHKPTLMLLCVTVLWAVFLSACGNYNAAFWAFTFASANITKAKLEDRFFELLAVAQQAQAGWNKQLESEREIIAELDKHIARFK